MLLSSNSIIAPAEDKKSTQARVKNMSEEQKEARLAQMKHRLTEIRNMEKYALSAAKNPFLCKQ